MILFNKTFAICLLLATIDKVFSGFTNVLHICYIFLLLKSFKIIEAEYFYFIISPNQFGS